jgi:hypothetical protein
MITWQRALFIIGLAFVEATPAALFLTLVGGDGWLPLCIIVLAGAVSDWAIVRWAPNRQKPATFVIGAVLALWLAKGQIGGGYGLGNWDTLTNLFAFSGRAGLAYVAMLTALYAFWRGLRVTDHDGVSLRNLFGRTCAVIIVMIGFAALGGALNTPILGPATVEVLGYFAVGLITIALAGSADETDSQMRRLDWRGLLTLVGAVGLIIALGLMPATLFGEEASLAIETIWQGILLVVVLILSPLLILIGVFLTWLLDAINIDEAARLLQQRQEEMARQMQQLEGSEMAALPPWLSIILRVFFGMLPILIILALILLSRRRRRHVTDRDEERESLWSWRSAADDLRNLFARRKADVDQGLRGALAQLRGDDPISRVRRSYIHLLMIGERRDQPRTLAQTPHEYEPSAAALVPRAQQAIAALTRIYERARYHPTKTTAADAERAEQAWRAIEEDERETGRRGDGETGSFQV